MSFTQGMILGRGVPIPGYQGASDAQYQLRDELSKAIIRLIELRTKYVTDVGQQHLDRDKANLQALTDMMGAMSELAKADAMSKQAAAEALRLWNKGEELAAKGSFRAHDSEVMKVVTTQTSALPGNLQRAMEDVNARNRLNKAITLAGGMYNADGTLNGTAVQAATQWVNENGGAAKITADAATALATVSDAEKANTAVAVANEITQRAQDAFQAVSTVLGENGTTDQIAAFGQAVGMELAKPIVSTVNSEQWQQASTLAEDSTAWMADKDRFIKSLAGVRTPPGFMEAFTRATAYDTEAKLKDPAARMADLEAMEPTYLDEAIRKLDADIAEVDEGIAQAEATPNDPILRGIQKLKRAVPRFDTWSQAMRFREPMAAARYAAAHPHELVQFNRLMQERPELANDPAAVREELRRLGEQQGWGYYVTPAGRAFQAPRPRSPDPSQEGAPAAPPPPPPVPSAAGTAQAAPPTSPSPSSTPTGASVGPAATSAPVPASTASTSTPSAPAATTGQPPPVSPEIEGAPAPRKALTPEELAHITSRAEASAPRTRTLELRRLAPGTVFEGKRGARYRVESDGSYTSIGGMGDGLNVSQANNPTLWASITSEMDESARDMSETAKRAEGPSSRVKDVPDVDYHPIGGVPYEARKAQAQERAQGLAQKHEAEAEVNQERRDAAMQERQGGGPPAAAEGATEGGQPVRIQKSEASVWDTVPPAEGEGVVYPEGQLPDQGGPHVLEESVMPAPNRSPVAAVTGSIVTPPLSEARRAAKDPLSLRLAQYARMG